MKHPRGKTYPRALLFVIMRPPLVRRPKAATASNGAKDHESGGANPPWWCRDRTAPPCGTVLARPRITFVPCGIELRDGISRCGTTCGQPETKESTMTDVTAYGPAAEHHA